MGSSVPTTIPDWMRLACQLKLQSKKAFVESAVDLAWLLTKHICQMTAAWPEKNLQDHITMENVVIFVDHPSKVSNVDVIEHAPRVTDAKFEFELEAGGISAVGQPQSRCSISICVALGNLLLELFSLGRSSLLNSSTGAPAVNGTSADCIDSIGIPDHRQNNNEIVPPRKRNTPMPSNGSSMSVAAKNLLLESGMPLPLCQLVCDLLGDDNTQNIDSRSLNPDDLLADAYNEECPDMALTSVKEAFWDLTKMKTEPKYFLFDRTCPHAALDDTGLFGGTNKQLIGRGNQTGSLMTSKNNIFDYTNEYDDNSFSTQGNGSLMCETMFLSGYAGSGKSSLLNTLIHSCNKDKWFVLSCKFDKLVASHMILTKAFNDFFEKWGPSSADDEHIDPAMKILFCKVCRRIFAALDDEGFHQLCGLIPNFAGMFPLLAIAPSDQDTDVISSMDKVGSAKQRLRSLFIVLIKSICSAGRPVLFVLDDLQWSESFVTEVIADFAMNDTFKVSGETCRQGLLITGAYRNNEVRENDDLIRNINFMKESGRAIVTTLNVGELTNSDITQLISSKLCLPWRYTKELAGLVLKKTRGNPFFVETFLKSSIQNKLLSFSVKFRRWVWDCDIVDMQMIAPGVAEILASTFSQLPSRMMKALKIVSCLGSQTEQSTIDALNLRNEILPFKIQDELQLAVKEGIMEKAGPMYQFTHDIIESTIYELIPLVSRGNLHKKIGMTLLKASSSRRNPKLFLIATDQINLFCKEGNPKPDEKAQLAEINAEAAKVAISASSFEQARAYLDVGMRLLVKQGHWETQYFLSLDLFEMSASVSCINGDISNMSRCLGEVLTHAREFDDSLKASFLLIKLLVSSSKFEEARSNCLMILSKLGEEFPQEVDLPVVLNGLSLMQTTLREITRNQIKKLPLMTNSHKLNIMKVYNMLCMCSLISKPMLLPLLSCRMVVLTMEYGFCADSIVGLATAGYSIFLYTEDIQLASNVGRVCESLVEESQMKHSLRSRLCNELYVTLKLVSSTFRSVVNRCPDLYNSAIMAGDTENASMCRWSYCSGGFWTASLDLSSVGKNLIPCIEEVSKYQQSTMIYSTMGLVHACSHLSGRNFEGIEIKTYDELDEIGEKTCNAFLAWQNFMHRMSSQFWMREYISVAELSEKYSKKYQLSPQTRILQVLRSFYEGIAYLNLARDTRNAKWRVLGEKTLATMKQFEAMMLKCNLENKCQLLEAELHYLDGNIESAEASYEASIESAQKNRFIHEEALAYEQYGIFCVENHRVDEGSKKLRLGLGKYEQWGALNKASKLQHFIDIIELRDSKSI